MATLKINEDLKKLISDYVLNLAYPVGSIYVAINNTNPKDLFGGTWERITGGFIYGRTDESWMLERGNGNGCWTNSTEESTTYEHALTVEQIPSHSHQIGFDQAWSWGGTTSIATTSGGPYGGNGYIRETGGNKGHSHKLAPHGHNIPYIGCYVWKRTA